MNDITVFWVLHSLQFLLLPGCRRNTVKINGNTVLVFDDFDILTEESQFTPFRTYEGNKSMPDLSKVIGVSPLERLMV